MDLKQNHGHIKMLIPIGMKSLLDYTRCVRLFRVDDDDREWVGKAGVIGFGQAIGSNNWEVCALDAFQLR